MKKILPLFSYLFHPLFIPVLTTVYFFYLDINFLVPAERYLVLIQVVIITILIPISFFFLLRSIGKIDSIMAHEIDQRKAPLMMHALLIYVLIKQSITLETIPELYFFFFGAMMSTLGALILIFIKVRASLHMMGMGGFLFFIMGLGLHNGINIINITAIWMIITGLVGSSRLSLGAHTMKELIFGFFLGLVPQVCTWYFWL